MKVTLEYVWLDGYTPEPNLRSKVKVEEINTNANEFKFPEWSFDGSSTNQANTENSDKILKPVRYYTQKSFPLENSRVYVLCEVLNSDGTPDESNIRSKVENQEDLWFGFEQEYFIKNLKTNNILGHETPHLEPQGKYYCGVGHNVVGRSFAEEHMALCLMYGMEITGINAEVALGQWEYQVFSKGSLKASDDLWMTRYFLHRLSEKYNYEIILHPKPIKGDWNGSGMHTNFSNERMRTLGGYEYFQAIFNTFGSRHHDHIKNYGSENNLRLTGKHETQSIEKYSYGIGDRGASIRIPKSTAENWKGYIEDRRPASNADSYKVVLEIIKSLKSTETLMEITMKMNTKINVDELSGKYGTVTNEELLKEYREEE
jgi:glutamine synthetase